MHGNVQQNKKVSFLGCISQEKDLSTEFCSDKVSIYTGICRAGISKSFSDQLFKVQERQC